MTVIVRIDGSGTYPAGQKVYGDLPRQQVAAVVHNWMLQRDVTAIVVLP
jgi:hypothetical protein